MDLKKKRAGFTLIETTLAIFSFAIISVGLIALISGVILGSNQQSGLLADSDQARKIVFNAISELRRSEAGADGGYSLINASSTELAFYSNLDSDAWPEKIRYFSQNGKLYKGVIKFNGALYPPSQEAVVTVQNNLANTSTPVFYYYSGSFYGSSTQTSLTQPVNVTQVKFVKINLQIYNKGGVKNKNIYTVSAGGVIRGLKTNLGE